MSEKTAMRIGGGIVGVSAWVLVAVLLWRTRVPDLSPPRLDPTSLLPERILARARRHDEVLDWLWVALTAAQLLVLAALAALGPRLARRARGPRLVRCAELALVAVAAGWAAVVAVRAVGHWWQVRYGLSHQGYGGWLVDRARELGWSLLVAAVLAVLLGALAHRLGRRWWIAGWVVVVAVGVAVTLVGPLLAPDTRPLPEGALRAEIGRLAASHGVGRVDVRLQRASRRTTLANAEAVGVGPANRIVLWDTLLDGRYTHAEIRFVAAHEVAHLARRHIWKGLAWLTLLAFPAAWVLARLADPADPAQVPRAVLAVVAIQLALLPVANAVSRRYEAEADWLALRWTHDPGAGRALFGRFARLGLEDPQPPGWVHVLLDDHPTPLQRAEMAAAAATTAGRAAAPRGGPGSP
jgi:Zn-dependent protease with chaperone function